MSIKLCQATGSTVTPLDDARLYSWIANRAVGIVTGCTVTSAGTNQLSIAAGWGVCQGHMFTISAETIGAVLATSGTLPGRLLIHIDTADTDMPVKFVTQAASILPALTQEDIDGSGSIYEIPLATYTAGTISISDLTSAAPAAPSLQSEIDSLNASCAHLSQNLAAASGTGTAVAGAGYTLAGGICVHIVYRGLMPSPRLYDPAKTVVECVTGYTRFAERQQ